MDLKLALAQKASQKMTRAAQAAIRRGYPTYQGGEHNTAERWALISAELKRQEARSVLDIGCAEGWFLSRAAAELGCFGIGVERASFRHLHGELGRLAEGAEGYAVIRSTLDADRIRSLPRCDVTLCLSVVHHVINQGGHLEAGREFLASLASVTDKAIIFETGVPNIPEWRTGHGTPRKPGPLAPRIKELLRSAGLRNVRELGRTVGANDPKGRGIWVGET